VSEVKYFNSRNNIYAYVLMIIGLFMAILDIQIVASSINDIQAALDASAEEGAWIQTAYLIAEVIMIPLTGWLTKSMSTRLLFSYSTAIFTVSSGLCAMAWNLPSMIIFRIVQGFFSGAMIPLAFSSLYRIFPPSEQVKYTVVAGLVATLGPSIGPTLGGWISENFSWHWLFLINILPGIIASIGVYKLLDIDQPNWSLFNNFDWFGFLLVAIALGCLEYALKEGVKYGWFTSTWITFFFTVIVLSFAILIWHELRTENCIINFRAFTDRNFSIGCLLSFTIGVGLFGIVYILPVMLAQVRGYDSLQIGLIMSVTGAFQFISAPICANLTKKIELRKILAIGMILFSIGLISNSYMTSDVAFNELFVPQMIRGISLMLCFLPLTAITLGTLPSDQIPNASSLYNLMRSLGGAIGISFISALIEMRNSYNTMIVSANLTLDRYPVVEQLNGAKVMLEPYHTDRALINKMSLAMFNQKVQEQVLIMTFNDIFFYLGVYLLACLVLVPLARKNVRNTGGGGH